MPWTVKRPAVTGFRSPRLAATQSFAAIVSKVTETAAPAACADRSAHLGLVGRRLEMGFNRPAAAGRLERRHRDAVVEAFRQGIRHRPGGPLVAIQPREGGICVFLHQEGVSGRDLLGANQEPCQIRADSRIRAERMNVIVFASRKGGSGKSTLTAHLAAHANRPSRRCMLIDCDPQGSISLWHKLRGTTEPQLRDGTRDVRQIIADARANGVEWASSTRRRTCRAR